MKQLTSFAFLLSLCASVSLHAADINDLTYDASGATVTITDCDPGASGALAIPEIIEGKPVTSIGSYTFYDCTSLVSINIPASVTSINQSAFWGCSSLVYIDVSFANPNYSDVNGALFNKNQTTILKYPQGKSEGSYSIPASVTSIGESAFYGCTSLTGITIPEGVTSIKLYAFRNCIALTGITLPTSIWLINTGAFYNCTSLAGITLPASVTNIKAGAFYGCTSLVSIDVEIANLNYSGVDGVLFNKDQTTILKYPQGKSGVSYSIPASVTSIGLQVFYGCTSLASINIPDGVTSIGSNAFTNCENLTSIMIPYGVSSLPKSLFSGCTSLASINIPDGVTSIGWRAFYGCTSLVDIVLTGNAPSLETDAFTSVNAAVRVFIMPWATGFDTTFGGLPVIDAIAFVSALETTATSNATEIAALQAQVAELSQRPTLEQIQDVRAGSLVFVADPAANQVRLSFTLEQTDDLVTWSPLVGGWWRQNADGSTLTRILPLDEPKRLLRVTLEE